MRVEEEGRHCERDWWSRGKLHLFPLTHPEHHLVVFPPSLARHSHGKTDEIHLANLLILFPNHPLRVCVFVCVCGKRSTYHRLCNPLASSSLAISTSLTILIIPINLGPIKGCPLYLTSLTRGKKQSSHHMLDIERIWKRVQLKSLCKIYINAISLFWTLWSSRILWSWNSCKFKNYMWVASFVFVTNFWYQHFIIEMIFLVNSIIEITHLFEKLRLWFQSL